MPAERNHVQDLETIFEALAESLVDAPDDQLLAEVRESGQDPKTLLAHVQDVLRRAVKQAQQRPLRDARQAYEARRQRLEQNPFALPESADERRTLFLNVVARNPAVGGMLTAHFREFDKLEDDDVTSCLKQLADLGLLDLDPERDS